jgi:hypothetical protein
MLLYVMNSVFGIVLLLWTKMLTNALVEAHVKFITNLYLYYILAVKLYSIPLAKISWTLTAWLSDIYPLSRLSLPSSMNINCHFSSTCSWILGLQLLVGYVQAYLDKGRFDFDQFPTELVQQLLHTMLEVTLNFRLIGTVFWIMGS